VRYLVRMIDDATSWSWGRFVERDATPQNMGVLWEYLKTNGRMVDVYTDRDSMFTVPPRPGESKEQQREADRLTQLGRALREWGSTPSWHVGQIKVLPQFPCRSRGALWRDVDRSSDIR
jgi:hypothetical protein